ncbi:MAG: DEAD/DEAH box helicase [Victivallaceae bacterium]|nr:DEAD/DEAH box helicase [Victivallaceae bacterium]
MFNSLKKKIKKLLGVSGGEVTVTITPKSSRPAARKSRDKDRDKDRDKSRERKKGAAVSIVVADEAKRERKRRKRKSEPAAAEVIPQVIRPEKPAELRDVPRVEGKTRFLDLPLHEDVQFGVQNAEFEYCTPIQAMTLPPLLEGRDLAGKAQTGTGKTAAFLLALFTRLLNNPQENRKIGQPRALVLAPTRELAMQIHKDAVSLGLFTPLRNVAVFGGMDHEKQRRTLEDVVDIVVGTPGRVIDYSTTGSLDLSRVEVLVIDEADRMLDMGFIPDVKRIVARLPRKGERQTLLFSATLDEHILRLSSGWLTDPIILESEPEKLVSENIEQTFYSVLREDKLALLLYMLHNEPYDRVLIFGNRKDINLKLQYDLARYGFEVPVLSGDIPQEKRIKVLERFRSGEEKIVIATDVAARGIHVDDVSLVVNFDLPERPEDYVHRIGRTGRAGHTGKSVSFLCEYGAYYLPDIEKLLGVQFPSVQPTEEMLKLPPPVEGAHLPPRPGRNSHGGGHRGGGHSGGGMSRGGSRRRF